MSYDIALWLAQDGIINGAIYALLALALLLGGCSVFGITVAAPAAETFEVLGDTGGVRPRDGVEPRLAGTSFPAGDRAEYDGTPPAPTEVRRRRTAARAEFLL